MNENNVLWSKTYIILFLTNFLMWQGFSLMMSTMPLYVLHLGAPQSQIGLVIGVYPFMALLARPFAGFAYDTMNRQKVFLISLAFFAFMTFGYTFAAVIAALILVRAIQGLFFGVATTGAGTIVADIVPIKRRGEGVGYFGLGNTLAMALGPAIGIYLMNAYGFRTLFIVSGSVMAISWVMAFFVNYPKREPQKKRLELKNIIEKRVLSVACLTAITGSIFGALVSYVVVFGTEIGLVNAGIYFLLNACGVAISRLFSGRILDQQGPKFVLLGGFLATSLGLATLSLSTGLLYYGIASILLGLGHGTIMPTLQAMVINMVSADRRGAATATHFASVDTGISGGAIILGWVGGMTSLSFMFMVCAALMLVPIVLLYTFVLRDYEAKTIQARQQITARQEAVPQA